MGFVQQKELRPLRDVEGSITWMVRDPFEIIFAHPLQFEKDHRPPCVHVRKQGFQRLIPVIGKERIGVRHVAVECRGIFGLYPFQPDKEHRLIRRQMGDIVEDAPFTRLDGAFQLFFGESRDQLADRGMLVLEPG